MPTLAPADAAPRVAELSAPGAFRGCIINAGNIGKSNDDLVAMGMRRIPTISSSIWEGASLCRHTSGAAHPAGRTSHGRADMRTGVLKTAYTNCLRK